MSPHIHILILVRNILAWLVLSLCFTPLLAAQDTPIKRTEVDDYRLNEAEMYYLSNEVKIRQHLEEIFQNAQLKDSLFPRDILRTGYSSLAKLYFNEGSLARIDENTVFVFRQGLRRFELTQGKGLFVVFPNSGINRIGTSDSNINIQSDLQQVAVVLVTHDGAKNVSTMHALTDGVELGEDRSLLGGQFVTFADGNAGVPEESDLEEFYKTETLANGLGPGQEHYLDQEPAKVQEKLTKAREATLAAIENQAIRISRQVFVRNALNGVDSGFSDVDDFRGDSTTIGLIDPQRTPGTFTRTGENTAIFQPSNATDPARPIEVDFDARSVTIDGRTGISNDFGLNGNNATGTVIFENGNATRIDVLDVNGSEPAIGETFQGTFTSGLAPDR